ncbi:DUF3575 domain-containing protein [Rhodocytophaga rosea]|uniref:DUF3575 domain-containing protein n=1 Tax=Rhodocytophaga rosea TaxID=2704465 RepID=A0A6C0GL97_9BACT|nr:DUF3575 domain-containing protein [Rhodocytophaga rosea]QHT68412.1 DUF3575 domain-containing protein [Rhodocytophaga rosea]
MKTAFICIIILSITFYARSQSNDQNNIVKGRIIILPLGGLMYSVGIGYERLIRNHFSLQVLINRSGIDMSSTDGANEVYNNVIPELKYYFNTREVVAKSYYISSFLEIQQNSITPGGEQSTDNYLISSKQKQASPGLLLGKNFQLSRKLHLETYMGAKYRMGNEKTEQVINSTQASFSRRYEMFGMRAGFNLAYRF